jgi:hypothetical protein
MMFAAVVGPVHPCQHCAKGHDAALSPEGCDSSVPDQCCQILLLLPAGAIMEEVISSVKGGVTGHTHSPSHRI